MFRLLGAAFLSAVVLAACGAPGVTPDSASAPPASDLVAPARALAWTFDATNYSVSLTVDASSAEFAGNVTISADIVAPIDGCVLLHAHPSLDLGEASWRAAADDVPAPLTLQRDGDVVTACPTVPFVPGAVLLDFRFSGSASDTEHYGLFTVQSQHSELPSFYTQFESQGARRLFPCYDEPHDKATTEFRITSDARYTMLSNGARREYAVHDDGTATAMWRNPDPISTYLVTVVVAELDQIEATFDTADGRTIPLTIYTEPGRAGSASFAMSALQQSLALFESTYGLPYPWDRYGIVAVPGFQYGGMENKGLANIGASQVYFDSDDALSSRRSIWGVVAHELAHEWFGNLVTMRQWQDLWLNEAFATYMGNMSSDRAFDPITDEMWEMVSLRTWYADIEHGPFSHPIVFDGYETPEDLIDGVTYMKGYKVVEMLVALVGRDDFFEAVNAYLDQHRLGNATTAEFFAAMQPYTDVDLDAFAATWLYEAGYPVLDISWSWDADTSTTTIHASQHHVGTGEPIAWTFPLTIGLQGASFDQTWKVVVTQAEETWTFESIEEPLFLSLDRTGDALIEWNIEGIDDDALLRQSRIDSSHLGRARALFELRERERERWSAVGDGATLDDTLVEAFRSAIADDEWRMRAFAAGLAANEQSVPLARALCSALGADLTTFFDGTEPALGGTWTMEIISARSSALVCLGASDDEAFGSLLREHAVSERVDYVVPAMRGLLRTSYADRFSRFGDAIAARLDDRPTVRQLVDALASSPDPGVIPALRNVVSDPEIVPPDDQRITLAYLRSFAWNDALAWTPEGLAYVSWALQRNLDRSSLIVGVLRAYQRVDEHTLTERRNLRGMLVELRPLIAAHPDSASPVGALDALLEAIDEAEATSSP